MFIDANTSRQDLEAAIVSNDALYRTFDEQRLLNDGFSTEELCQAVIAWIEAGDECRGA